MCLDAVCFKKQQQRRADYGFHAYMELCQLVYCLLSRSRHVSSLLNVNAWEEYMDVSKLSQFEVIPTAEFLQNYDFGAMLREFKGSEGRDFQDRCREFIDRFVELILAQQAASSEFTSGLFCFCPGLLLEGDDKYVFDLFNQLARRLERCGVISDVECKSAVEELRTFVVDVRGRHATSDEVAENIPDVVSYLLGDYSFLARKKLCRVFELCCLVVLKPRQKYPDVDINLSGCAVPYWTVTSCIRGVQSCVLSSNYKQKAFFTKHTMDSVRNAINGAQDFMNLASYDPWERICCGGQESFVTRYLELFNAFLSRKKGESYSNLRHANKRGRKMLAGEGGDVSTVSCSESPSSSVVGSSVAATPEKGHLYSSVGSLLGRKKNTGSGSKRAVDSSKVSAKRATRKSSDAATKKQ